ncbi:unnamed protein product [Bemisia tabaci]|uniref:Mannosyl-oligosaccharide glucosidase n=1 Tax=Bemisia tabaci TaxID=7038 RepID=A0A9P0F8D3_BEMTA|nr:unnamed protein product [Bemisia tabaci]
MARPKKPLIPTLRPNAKKRQESSTSSISIITILKISLVVGLVSSALWIVYRGYLETRVNTRFDHNKMVVRSGLDVPELYWGSYRGGVYFGMKTREPNSLVTGLMWYFPSLLRAGHKGIRHWCESGDNLDGYSWVAHDGKNFGVQNLNDGSFHIETSFVKRVIGKNGGDWTNRISITAEDKMAQNEQVTFLYYIATEAEGDSIMWTKGKTFGFEGRSEKLGNFNVRLVNISGSIDYVSFLSAKTNGYHELTNTVVESLRLNGNQIVLLGDTLKLENKPNFIVSQITARVPFSFEVIYESLSADSVRTDSLSQEVYTNTLENHKKNFFTKFENKFKLSKKGFTDEEMLFAEAAFSNLLGGVSYFYGASKVQSKYTANPVPYWKAPLYTAVPSRSFFPRGFLWDEGFHGFLIAAWDLDIELDIMSHWLDLMNVEGWIPREQILGKEALSKVPEEFVVQFNTNANPPTFFLTLQFILKHFSESIIINDDRLAAVERLYPRLVRWFDWFNTTQNGAISSSYYWRGRNAETNRELNPKTLSSGLDDYPRASHPTELERHLDLRCWLMISAGVLAEIADLLKKPNDKFLSCFNYLSNNDLLNELHWSNAAKRYADYGLHTDDVALMKPKAPAKATAPPKEAHRVVKSKPVYQFVDSTYGYVTLFPFLSLMLDPESHTLGEILSEFKNPELLWTDFGLRSLSKTSPLYMKRNTEHDPPYWRGPIWIQMNYLALRALSHYSESSGPYASQAKSLYSDLRKNVIGNMFRQFKKTGFIWEQYNDVTGEGQGCRPFNGWSSLVVLMMAEIY